MAGMTIEGVVEHGRRLGRELGFPTANMAVPDSVTAADGVYYSRAEVDGTLYDAMSNLGSNPSVGGAVRHLETHIFGFGGSLYGRTLRVELVRKIRDERRFATIGELRAQIARDKEYILELKDSGIAGVAVISAILAQKDIHKATQCLKEICQGLFND